MYSLAELCNDFLAGSTQEKLYQTISSAGLLSLIQLWPMKFHLLRLITSGVCLTYFNNAYQAFLVDNMEALNSRSRYLPSLATVKQHRTMIGAEFYKNITHFSAVKASKYAGVGNCSTMLLRVLMFTIQDLCGLKPA